MLLFFDFKRNQGAIWKEEWCYPCYGEEGPVTLFKASPLVFIGLLFAYLGGG